jgi:hypothetical protein
MAEAGTGLKGTGDRKTAARSSSKVKTGEICPSFHEPPIIS